MPFYTDANGKDITGEVLGSKSLWTSTNPGIGETYGDNSFSLVIPKESNIKTIADAQGRTWGEVLPGTSTDDLVYPNLTDNNIIRINNVVDPGGNSISIMTKKKDALPGESVTEYLNRKYIGDDLVLGKNVRRKSLLGNNGEFDLNNPNIFKSLIPLGLGTSIFSEYNK